MRFSKRVIVPVGCLCIGIAAGYGIAHYQTAKNYDSSANEQVSIQDSQAADSINSSIPVLPVHTYDQADNLLKKTTGILLANPTASDSLLLTSAAAMYQADRVEMVAHQIQSLNRIVAVDPAAGLLLLNVDLPGHRTFKTSADTSLYLGKDILAVSPHEEIQGLVDSPVQQLNGRYYSYTVRLQSSLSSELAALLDRNNGALLGIIVGKRHSDGNYIAVDVAHITNLISRVGIDPPQSVRLFGEQFLPQSLPGSLLHITQAGGRNDWQTIIAAGQGLHPEDLAGHDEATSQIDYAYLQQANTMLDIGQYEEALGLLDEADRLLESSPVRSRMRARTLFEAGRPLQAIRALVRGIDQGIADDQTYVLLQSMVLEIVGSSGHSLNSKNEVLNLAIERDANFAPYHATHGKLLYSQNRYAEALSSLNFATQLDPGMRSELQALMNAARQRLNAVGQIVVPLQKNGNSIMVDVSVNNVPMRFMLDTGASLTVLSEKAANDIGLSASGSEHVFLHTANGAVRAPIIQIPQVRLGEAVATNLKAAILNNMGPVQGLLGLNFLNQFDIDIDHSMGELILSYR